MKKNRDKNNLCNLFGTALGTANSNCNTNNTNSNSNGNVHTINTNTNTNIMGNTTDRIKRNNIKKRIVPSWEELKGNNEDEDSNTEVPEKNICPVICLSQIQLLFFKNSMQVLIIYFCI